MRRRVRFGQPERGIHRAERPAGLAPAGHQLAVGAARAIGLADRERVDVFERQEALGDGAADQLGLEPRLLEGADRPDDRVGVRRERAVRAGHDEPGRDHASHELDRYSGRRRHVQFGWAAHGGRVEHPGAAENVRPIR